MYFSSDSTVCLIELDFCTFCASTWTSLIFMHVIKVMLQYDLFGWCCYKNFVYVFLFFRVLICVNLELVRTQTDPLFYIYSVFGISFLVHPRFVVVVGLLWYQWLNFLVSTLQGGAALRSLYIFFLIFNFWIWIWVCSVGNYGIIPKYACIPFYFFVTCLHTLNSGRTSVCV